MVENKKEAQITFVEGFSSREMHLFEVDEDFIAQIENNKSQRFAQIKTSLPSVKEEGAAIEENKKVGMSLITDSRTFKLKIAESTNHSFILNPNNKEIQMKTSNQIEVTPTKTKTLQILNFFKQNGMYSLQNGDQRNGVSLEKILACCQVSEGELKTILENPEHLARLQIMPCRDTNTFVHLNSQEFCQIIEKILTLLGCHETQLLSAFESGIDVKTVQSLNQGELNGAFAHFDTIWIGLAVLGKLEGDKFKFTAEKVRKALAVALLVQKGDYILEEFTQVYLNAVEMALPPSVMKEEVINDNIPLFDGYSSDFSFLKGLAVIKPSTHNSSGDQSGKTVIIWLDPYFSPALFYITNTDLCSTFEQQITKLFEVKGKWCYSELENYLKDYIEPEQKLSSLLTRWTRTVKEQNPFNKTMSTFYVPKF